MNAEGSATGAFRRTRAARAVAGLAFGMALAVLYAGAAQAQFDQAYVYVRDLKVTQLSNAVRVTIEADGTIQLRRSFDPDLTNLFDFSNGEKGKRVRQIQLRLRNCRSKVGSFRSVNLYPIDHLEFAVPEDSPNGIGLDVKVVLDTDAQAREFLQFPGGRLDNDNGPGIWIEQPPDRRSVSITVTSDLFPQKKSIRKTAADAAGAQSLSVTQHGVFTDLSATNEPLSEVAEAVARASGLPVGVEPHADRLISAVLRDQKPEDLLVLIAQAYGLSLTTLNGAFLFSDEDSSTGEQAAATSVPVHYLEPAHALSLLPTFLVQQAHADTLNNAVVVSGPPGLTSKVAHDIAVLDQPTPQCRVSAIFVTHSRTSAASHTLALERRTPDSTLGVQAGSAGVPTGLMIYDKASGTAPGIDAELQALKQDSSLTVDARPSVLITNGQPSTVFGGQSHYVVLNSTFGGGGLQKIDVGNSITVTPLIGAKGRVTLNVQLSSTDVASTASGLPTLETRTVSDTIRILSGDTLYLGGLTSLQPSVRRFKIPLLGDLPLIGGLFRGRRSSRDQVEIAVFIKVEVQAPDGRIQG